MTSFFNPFYLTSPLHLHPFCCLLFSTYSFSTPIFSSVFPPCHCRPNPDICQLVARYYVTQDIHKALMPFYNVHKIFIGTDGSSTFSTITKKPVCIYLLCNFGLCKLWFLQQKKWFNRFCIVSKFCRSLINLIWTSERLEKNQTFCTAN